MDKILIVEDDITLATLFKKFLEDKGYVVAHVETATSALKWIEMFRFELAVIDIGLPDINGIEL